MISATPVRSINSGLKKPSVKVKIFIILLLLFSIISSVFITIRKIPSDLAIPVSSSGFHADPTCYSDETAWVEAGLSADRHIVGYTKIVTTSGMEFKSETGDTVEPALSKDWIAFTVFKGEDIRFMLSGLREHIPTSQNPSLNSSDIYLIHKADSKKVQIEINNTVEREPRFITDSYGNIILLFLSAPAIAQDNISYYNFSTGERFLFAGAVGILNLTRFSTGHTHLPEIISEDEIEWLSYNGKKMTNITDFSAEEGSCRIALVSADGGIYLSELAGTSAGTAKKILNSTAVPGKGVSIANDYICYASRLYYSDMPDPLTGLVPQGGQFEKAPELKQEDCADIMLLKISDMRTERLTYGSYVTSIVEAKSWFSWIIFDFNRFDKLPEYAVQSYHSKRDRLDMMELSKERMDSLYASHDALVFLQYEDRKYTAPELLYINSTVKRFDLTTDPQKGLYNDHLVISLIILFAGIILSFWVVAWPCCINSKPIFIR